MKPLEPRKWTIEQFVGVATLEQEYGSARILPTCSIRSKVCRLHGEGSTAFTLVLRLTRAQGGRSVGGTTDYATISPAGRVVVTDAKKVMA